MKLGTTDISKVYLGSTEVDKAMLGSTEVYSSGPDYSEPFYVEDISGISNELVITPLNSPSSFLIEKSTDGVNWSTLGSSGTLRATVPANSKLYLRAQTNSWCTKSSNRYHGKYINCSLNFKIGGNIMSLLYGSNFTGNETSFPTNSSYVFSYLFYNASHLVSAEKLLLPSRTMYLECYARMFLNCPLLTTPPALPATTLAEGCYTAMFQTCPLLTTPPALPATTLANNCYSYMFNACSSLTTAPTLPATTLANYCYQGMFYGCTSLTTAPDLPATTLAQYCYNCMFTDCTNLITGPKIYANPTSTVEYACYMMFAGCKSLQSLEVNFTKWLYSSVDGYTMEQWTKLGANTNGTFTCPSSLPKMFNSSGNSSTGSTASGIPYGWTVVEK